MSQLCAKVYYETSTGKVVLTTSEYNNGTETTKEQDMLLYPNLQNKSVDDVDYIELEYGTVQSIFTNLKYYVVNLETKTLECTHYTSGELGAMQSNIEQQ